MSARKNSNLPYIIQIEIALIEVPYNFAQRSTTLRRPNGTHNEFLAQRCELIARHSGKVTDLRDRVRGRRPYGQRDSVLGANDEDTRARLRSSIKGSLGDD